MALRISLLLIAAIAVEVGAIHIDFPAWSGDRHATEMAEAAFASRPVKNAYFTLYGGFLQGAATCYYRFETTEDSVRRFLAAGQLVEIEDDELKRQFVAGTPYWWHPTISRSTHFYSFRPHARCVFSWDSESHRCFLRR